MACYHFISLMNETPWPQTWDVDPSPERCRVILAELQRELPNRHMLIGRSLTIRAIDKRNADWIACSLEDGRAALIHLTWNKETDPTWPWTLIFDDLEGLKKNPDWYGSK
jgi:hypothetical protein